MSETATGNQTPIGQTGQTGQTGQSAPIEQTHQAAPTGLAITEESRDALTGAAPAPGESRASGRPKEGETAREVGAQHLARLLYAPVNTWSRYVFHENDPHPFGAARKKAGRG